MSEREEQDNEKEGGRGGKAGRGEKERGGRWRDRKAGWETERAWEELR